MAKILIVEDVADTRHVMEEVLSKLGHSIDTANDGEDAEIYMSTFPYDLVITDILMPNKNGFELIRSIKKQAPETKILAISGGGQYVQSDLTTTLASLESNQALKKPFTKVELVNAVNELLTANAQETA